MMMAKLGLVGKATQEVSFLPNFEPLKRNRIGVQQMFGLALKPTKSNIQSAMGDLMRDIMTAPIKPTSDVVVRDVSYR